MAIYNSGIDISFTAAVDLNDYQYRFVTTGSVVGECMYVSTAGTSVIGVLQNDPRAGEEATVRVFGGTKVVGNSTSALVHGGWIKTSASADALGYATNTGGSTHALGFALEALSTGCALVEIFLLPGMCLPD